MATIERTWRRLLSSAPDEAAYRKLPRWRLSKPKQICLEKVNDLAVLVNPYTDCSNSLRDDTPFERLNRIAGRKVPMSAAKGVFDTLDPSIPHLGTIVIEGAPSDDRLRWSEVCWAASLMASRLREGQYQAHEIIPVSIYHELLLALANVAL
jgi:hypothetical protein